MDTLHEVRDTAKVTRIAKSIEENGWIGAPMVADGELLITGVHRYAALEELDMTMDAERDYIIDIRNLIEDYDAKIEERMSEDGDEWYEAMKAIVAELGVDTQTEYGLDAD